MRCVCGNNMKMVRVENVNVLIERTLYKCRCGNWRVCYESFGGRDLNHEEIEELKKEGVS